MDALQHIFAEHWKFLLVLSTLVGAIQTMPTPCVNGNPCNWYYKWIFQFAHVMTLQWARVFAMYNPVFAKAISTVEYKHEDAPLIPLHNSSGVLDKL